MEGHGEGEAIGESAVFRDLGRLRTRGYWNLRGLEVPAVTALARQLGPSGTTTDAVRIEKALKAGVERLGNSEYAEAAALLLGVAPRSRGLRVGERREKAAKVLGEMSSETFRTRHEKVLLEDLAGQLCSLAIRSSQGATTHDGDSQGVATAAPRKTNVNRLAPRNSVAPDRAGCSPTDESAVSITNRVRQLLGQLTNERGEVDLRRLLECVEARQQLSAFEALQRLREEGGVSWEGDLGQSSTVYVHLGHERMHLHTPRRSLQL